MVRILSPSLLVSSLALLLVLTGPAPAGKKTARPPEAAPLYASDGTTLFRVNPTDATAQPVVTIQPAPSKMVGLTDRPSQHAFYALTFNSYDLYTIDPASGASTGPTTISGGAWTDDAGHPLFPLRALAYNPLNQRLYAFGASWDSGWVHIAQINPENMTVERIQVSAQGGSDITSAAFDPWTGYLVYWGTVSTTIIDPGTPHPPQALARTPIPEVTRSHVLYGAAFSPTTPELYFAGFTLGSDEGPSLFRTNRLTGQTVRVGPISVSQITFGEPTIQFVHPGHP